jgi:hypothetical protein
MKASKTILVAVLTIGSVGLAATSALACHGGSGYGSGYSSSYYRPHYVERVYVKEQPVVVALTFAPAHSVVVVMPSDSWPSICAREYGNPAVWGNVADFNGVPRNVQLTGGMQLRLPVINPNGTFSLSSAPAAIAMPPQGFAGGFPQGFPQGGQPGPQGGLPQANGFVQQVAPQQVPMGLPQGAQLGQEMKQLPPQGPTGPQSHEISPKNSDSVAQRIADQLTGLPGLPSGQSDAPSAGPTDRPLPSIVIGSIMTINGQPLGDNRGTVRLIVNGSPVALEIVEWAANTAKVRIPADLPAGLQVQIEILRADGSVVAKDAVQLAAGQKVAAAN